MISMPSEARWVGMAASNGLQGLAASKKNVLPKSPADEGSGSAIFNIGYPWLPQNSIEFITCLSHVYHMFITCLSHVYHMFITCLSHVSSVFFLFWDIHGYPPCPNISKKSRQSHKWEMKTRGDHNFWYSKQQKIWPMRTAMSGDVRRRIRHMAMQLQLSLKDRT